MSDLNEEEKPVSMAKIIVGFENVLNDANFSPIERVLIYLKASACVAIQCNKSKKELMQVIAEMLSSIPDDNWQDSKEIYYKLDL